MRILLTSGGTAGHINPALAVMAKLPSDAKVLFVGNKNHMEYKLVTGAGYDFKHINALGIRRRLTIKNIFYDIYAIILFLHGMSRSRRIIQKFKPDVVIGFGGYVTCPVVYEATFFRGIKTLTHEANAFPGITTKFLSRRVNKVLIAMNDAIPRLKIKDISKVVYTGNPVRKEILSYDREQARKELNIGDRLFVLSFGGSLGAENINNTMGEYFDRQDNNSVIYMHSTGEKNYEEYINQFKNKKENVIIRPYIDDMPRCMAAADIVISRAGAITLSEIECAGKASILIPSPYVTENHQYHNAMELVNYGCSKVILEDELSFSKIKKELDELINNPTKIIEMSNKAKELAVTDSAEKIIKEIYA